MIIKTVSRKVEVIWIILSLSFLVKQTLLPDKKIQTHRNYQILFFSEVDHVHQVILWSNLQKKVTGFKVSLFFFRADRFLVVY